MQIGMMAGGIAAGAAVGAGIALLITSKTGPQRRAGIARKARHLGHDAEQRWEDLAFALKEAARGTRDRFRHRHAAAESDETDADD
jgi:gas vesicle protein